jgi:hypothetical protein
VRIVLVDVVTQGKGEPVGGLHKEDLRTGSSNNSSWSMVIEEMFGGQH